MDFIKTSNSFLESFWEPSLLTYSLLVAPVAKIVDIFDVFFQAVKGGLRESRKRGPGAQVGGRGGASGGRGRLRLRALKGFASHV